MTNTLPLIAATHHPRGGAPSIPMAPSALHHLRLRGRRQESTLIGRLLVDSRSVLQTSRPASQARRGRPGAVHRRPVAEREQGITIDVAYRYFATPTASSSSATRRPRAVHPQHGHAASSADAAVVLVDATKPTGRTRPELPGTRAPQPAGEPAARAVHRVRREQARTPWTTRAGLANIIGAAGVCCRPRASRWPPRCPSRPSRAGTWSTASGWWLLQRPQPAASAGTAATTPAETDVPALPSRAVGGKVLVVRHRQGRRAFWGRVAPGRWQWRTATDLAQRPDQDCPGADHAPADVEAGAQRGHRLDREVDVARRLDSGCAQARRQPPADETLTTPRTQAFLQPAAHAKSRPPWPGWTTSPWLPAACTGRCTATAGSRPRSSASCTSWTSTPGQEEHDASNRAQRHRPHLELALQEPIAALPCAQSRVLGALILVDTATHTRPPGPCWLTVPRTRLRSACPAADHGPKSAISQSHQHHDPRRYRSLYQVQIHRLRGRLSRGLLPRRPELPHHRS